MVKTHFSVLPCHKDIFVLVSVVPFIKKMHIENSLFTIKMFSKVQLFESLVYVSSVCSVSFKDFKEISQRESN